MPFPVHEEGRWCVVWGLALKADAIHEAGHCAFAIPIISVSIDADPHLQRGRYQPRTTPDWNALRQCVWPVRRRKNISADQMRTTLIASTLKWRETRER